jgi:hypothetical protein
MIPPVGEKQDRICYQVSLAARDEEGLDSLLSENRTGAFSHKVN